MKFDKEKFLAANSINKKPLEGYEGLFVSELTISQQDKINTALTKSALVLPDEEKKMIVTEEGYLESKYLRVSFGLVDEKGEQIFNKDEVENLKDIDFVENANDEILKINTTTEKK